MRSAFPPALASALVGGGRDAGCNSRGEGGPSPLDSSPSPPGWGRSRIGTLGGPTGGRSVPWRAPAGKREGASGCVWGPSPLASLPSARALRPVPPFPRHLLVPRAPHH